MHNDNKRRIRIVREELYGSSQEGNMSDESKNTEQENNECSESEADRMCVADAVCRQACEDSGLRVTALQDFDAWKEYVEGRIGESQLTDRANGEMQEFSKVFGKYVLVDKQEEAKAQKEEEEKRARAKQANAIYREVCAEKGLTLCFFSDFRSWSDFVEGRIDESEFHEKAKLEAQKIATGAA